MAAVTQVTPPQRNVIGNRLQMLYNITGVNGDYIDTGMNNIAKVNMDVPTVLTSYAVSIVNGQKRLTLTSTGAYTAAKVEVIGN